jgi:tetrahydromethanopterin S-methyltransferase subunit D
VRALAERGRPAPSAGSVDTGVLAASGLVAGEGLAGVLVAALVATGVVSKPVTSVLPAEAGALAALTVALLVLAFLYRGGRAAAR